jgi:hypothetical protein
VNDREEFVRLVATMREAQRRYFRTRSPTDLEYSRGLERKVDAAIREIVDGPSLFDQREDVP